MAARTPLEQRPMDRLHTVHRQWQAIPMGCTIQDSTPRVCSIPPTPSTAVTRFLQDRLSITARPALNKMRGVQLLHPTRYLTAKRLLATQQDLTLTMEKAAFRMLPTPTSSPCSLDPSMRPGPTLEGTDPHHPSSSGSPMLRHPLVTITMYDPLTLHRGKGPHHLHMSTRIHHTTVSHISTLKTSLQTPNHEPALQTQLHLRPKPPSSALHLKSTTMFPPDMQDPSQNQPRMNNLQCLSTKSRPLQPH